MVDGGLGIQGISQTPFYRFVSSDEGLSQLGIRPQDPPRLLEGYRKSFRVNVRGGVLRLQFGNHRALKFWTPHFASGTGRLRVKSWMEWVLDKKGEPAGYVPRSKVPGGWRSHIRLRPPLGGLMLPKGVLNSPGMWRLSSSIQNYEITWFNRNRASIEAAIERQLKIILMRQFRS